MSSSDVYRRALSQGPLMQESAGASLLLILQKCKEVRVRSPPSVVCTAPMSCMPALILHTCPFSRFFFFFCADQQQNVHVHVCAIVVRYCTRFRTSVFLSTSNISLFLNATTSSM